MSALLVKVKEMFFFNRD